MTAIASRSDFRRDNANGHPQVAVFFVGRDEHSELRQQEMFCRHVTILLRLIATYEGSLLTTRDPLVAAEAAD
jgi:hypothetical protein